MCLLLRRTARDDVCVALALLLLHRAPPPTHAPTRPAPAGAHGAAVQNPLVGRLPGEWQEHGDVGGEEDVRMSDIGMCLTGLTSSRAVLQPALALASDSPIHPISYTLLPIVGWLGYWFSSV